jgi:hypothetical protein
VYVANYIYTKKTARTIDVIGQGIFITGCDSGISNYSRAMMNGIHIKTLRYTISEDFNPNTI